MNAERAPLLKAAMPEFAAILETRLAEQDEPELAEQVSRLRIVARCGCDDYFCGSFYTVPRPAGAWGPGHENVVLEGDVPGDVI
ncbi:MAG TPA: hypothetical protein VJ744_04935, partial [Gaiellaceae bacterium]|nr:hypothetical protein [Gaiellaceae bacterium]